MNFLGEDRAKLRLTAHLRSKRLQHFLHSNFCRSILACVSAVKFVNCGGHLELEA